MGIKKFTGSTAKEAVDKMRAEFGDDAVVLNTRRVARGGIMSVAGGEYVEVTAAFDETPMRVAPKMPIRSGDAQGAEVVGSLRELAARFSESQPSPERRNRADLGQNYSRQPATMHPASVVESEILKQEFSEVKNALGEIADHIKHSKMPVLSGPLNDAYSSLIENEVDQNIALEVVETCNHNMSGTALEDRITVEKSIVNIIGRYFIEAPRRIADKKGYVVALVGPTGVGKTTTIAKLASIDKLIRGKKVGIITADTYRIGAIDQLRTFADIASIPLSVVYNPEEMAAAVTEYSSYDVIYVDTVGRSQRSVDKISELAKFTDAADPREVHLVISVNFSPKTARDVLERFNPVKPNRVLLTKTDEATSLGLLLSLAKESKLPFSYITTGQSVPEDIEPASAARLAKLVYPNGFVAHADQEKELVSYGAVDA